MKVFNRFKETAFGRLTASGVCIVSCLLMLTASPLYAGITVSNGASIMMNDGTIVMNCSNIEIESGSTVNVGDGTIESCGDLTIDSGGQLVLSTGNIRLNGTFTLDGTITMGTGSIDFTDGCDETNLTGGTGDHDGDTLTNSNDPDDDNDGMSDDWEIFYALNFLFNDASKDADADGYTNLEEFLEGTDPNDADDMPPEEFPWEIFYPAFIKKHSSS